MAITPGGLDYMRMEANDILIMTLNGKILDGFRIPSSEWRMHAAIYKNRTDIQGVIHTHSPHATSFAVANLGIPFVLTEMIHFIGGDIRVAPPAMPGTEELGLSALIALKDRNSCLLANHGVLAIGTDLHKAYNSALYRGRSKDMRVCPWSGKYKNGADGNTKEFEKKIRHAGGTTGIVGKQPDEDSHRKNRIHCRVRFWGKRRQSRADRSAQGNSIAAGHRRRGYGTHRCKPFLIRRIRNDANN
jgi:hypothetical protein